MYSIPFIIEKHLTNELAFIMFNCLVIDLKYQPTERVLLDAFSFKALKNEEQCDYSLNFSEELNGHLCTFRDRKEERT